MRTDNSLINSCKFYNVTDEDRVECIKKLLRLDHINQDEYEHVEKLIKNKSQYHYYTKFFIKMLFLTQN